MPTRVLGFGIVKEIFSGPWTWVELAPGSTAADLRQLLEQEYPSLKDLASYMIAINNNYAHPGDTFDTGDEIAIIPPVSGG